MKGSILFFFLIIPFVASAQEDSYFAKAAYNWEEQRDRVELPTEFQDEAAVIVKNFTSNEYAYSPETFDLELFTLTHKIIRINTESGINRYNKIYLPFSDGDELAGLKARSISPDGTIKIIDNDDIKELNDEQEEQGFRIFAVDGVEVGTEVEYFYTEKVGVRYFGREYFQSKVPTLKAEFELICPDNLEFSFKSYNGFPEVEEEYDSTQRIYSVTALNVPKLQNEAYSFYNSNRQRLDFKLSYNKSTGNSRLLTWADASKRIHESIYSLDIDELNAVQNFYDGQKLKNKLSDTEKIREIENLIKTEFGVRDLPVSDYSNIKFILENKFGNERGMAKLFAALFKLARLEHQLVLTSDRTSVRFDPSFDSWNYLAKYFIYFPKLDQYLAPNNSEYRLGMIPFQYTNNEGLFISEVAIGEELTGVGELKFIEPLGYDESVDNMNVSVQFSDSFDKTMLDIERVMTGYNAIFIQPYYSFLTKDKQQEVIENYMRLSAGDAKIDQIEVENGDWNLSPLKSPFKIRSKMETSTLIERAGPKYLLKVGEVIGPQTELYQDEERNLPVENDYNRKYDRKISIEIPTGYTVKNLDKLKFDVSHEIDGDEVFNFTSTYELKGNELLINIDENYKRIACSKECFEPFRKVINAAADFNKVILVMEKEK